MKREVEKRYNMDHQLRYIVSESCYTQEFVVYDEREKEVMCTCTLRKNAGTIAGLLNYKENGKNTKEV